MQHFDVIIVGGGIAGLSCAEALTAEGVNVFVLERKEMLGGRIRTFRSGSTTIETGASFMAGFYDTVRELIEKSDIPIETKSDSQETWLCRPAAPPGPIWPLNALGHSRSISRLAKFRALGGAIWMLANAKRIPRPALDEHLKRFDRQSVMTWGRRAFGSEVYMNVLEPLVRSLFFWDCARTTRAMVPPIIKGVLMDRHFYRLSNGMDTLPANVAKHVSYKTGACVRSIKATGTHCIVTSDDAIYTCKVTVLACPATEAVKILDASNIMVNTTLRSTKYSSIGVGIIKSTIPERSNLGLRTVVVSSEFNTSLIAFKIIPTKDNFFFRFYWKSSDRYNSKDICRRVADELTTFGLKDVAAEIAKGQIVDWIHWDTAIPEFDVGSIKHIVDGDLSKNLPSNIVLAGDYTVAPHLEGAVSSGVLAAKRSLQLIRL